MGKKPSRELPAIADAILTGDLEKVKSLWEV